MTRYMAQYRHIGESHSDNSFSPTKRVDFLKDMTEYERNDCEMLILLLMKGFACMKLSQIISMSSHFSISQSQFKKIKLVVPFIFKHAHPFKVALHILKCYSRETDANYVISQKVQLLLQCFCSFQSQEKFKYTRSAQTGNENIQWEVHPRQNNTDPVESTASIVAPSLSINSESSDLTHNVLFLIC